MEIKSMIDSNNILFDNTITSKKELFTKMAHLLKSNGYIKNEKKFIEDLYKRENETSTGIEDEFGIPHTKSKHVLKPTIAFAHTGVISDYVALDETKVQYAFMLAVPLKSNDVHLDLLSSLSRKLMDNDFRTKLKEAETNDQVIHFLTN